MLVCKMKLDLDGCFAATIILYPAPTGQDVRGGDPNATSFDEKFCLEGRIRASLTLVPCQKMKTSKKTS